MPDCYTILITRFRISAHTLLIEKGRYHNIERGKRICQMVDMNDVEDEYHFCTTCHLLMFQMYTNDPKGLKLINSNNKFR